MLQPGNNVHEPHGLLVQLVGAKVNKIILLRVVRVEEYVRILRVEL